MHGRAKIRSPAEMEELKRKDRIEKAQKYKKAMDKLIQKKQDNLLDEEAMEIAKTILISNPDVQTIWNIRREVLEETFKTCIQEKFEQCLKDEIALTEQCLRNNPKSYGTWHHRRWAINQVPNNDWKRELNLLNRLLDVDDRNFHCWDYRRFVMKQTGFPEISELTFTTDRIMTNFSNYSAWHLRSKILPKVYPDPSNPFLIKEDYHRMELHLVHNATFTDPDDQSGWFYLRWLLALPPSPLSICQASIITNNLMLVTFSLPVRIGDHTCQIRTENDTFLGKWTNSKKKDNHSQAWLFTTEMNLPYKQNVTLELYDKNGKSLDIIVLKKERRLEIPCAWRRPCFDIVLGEQIESALVEELASCRELLELEESNKWTLLTMVYIMQTLNRAKYRDECLQVLEKLIICDPYRANFYKDLKSRYIIETALDRGFASEYPFTFIDLSNKGLTTLYHTEYFSLAQRLNLSGNKLTNKVFPQLKPLQNCEELNLSGNKGITSLDEIPSLRSLKEIIITQTSVPIGVTLPPTLPSDCKITF